MLVCNLFELKDDTQAKQQNETKQKQTYKHCMSHISIGGLMSYKRLKLQKVTMQHITILFSARVSMVSEIEMKCQAV